jgi:hypothetical protein
LADDRSPLGGDGAAGRAIGYPLVSLTGRGAIGWGCFVGSMREGNCKSVRGIFGYCLGFFGLCSGRDLKRDAIGIKFAMRAQINLSINHDSSKFRCIAVVMSERRIPTYIELYLELRNYYIRPDSSCSFLT